MISRSRCPHAGHVIVDAISIDDPPRHFCAEEWRARKNSASKARRTRLFLTRSKDRLQLRSWVEKQSSRRISQHKMKNRASERGFRVGHVFKKSLRKSTKL